MCRLSPAPYEACCGVTGGLAASPRARLRVSITLKLRLLTEDLAVSGKLWRAVAFDKQMPEWEAFSTGTCRQSEGEFFHCWLSARQCRKFSKETQLILLLLANGYLDVYQREGLWSQETQRAGNCCDGLRAWGCCSISNTWKHFLPAMLTQTTWCYVLVGGR